MEASFRLGPHLVRVLAIRPGYCLAEGEFVPGIPGPAPHSHDWDEGFYVIDGELDLHVDGEDHVLGPGEFSLAPGGSIHTFKAHGDHPAKIFATFGTGVAIDYLREMADLIGSGPPDPDLLEPLHAKYGVRIHA